MEVLKFPDFSDYLHEFLYKITIPESGRKTGKRKMAKRYPEEDKKQQSIYLHHVRSFYMKRLDRQSETPCGRGGGSVPHTEGSSDTNIQLIH